MSKPRPNQGGHYHYRQTLLVVLSIFMCCWDWSYINYTISMHTKLVKHNAGAHFALATHNTITHFKSKKNEKEKKAGWSTVGHKSSSILLFEELCEPSQTSGVYQGRKWQLLTVCLRQEEKGFTDVCNHVVGTCSHLLVKDSRVISMWKSGRMPVWSHCFMLLQDTSICTIKFLGDHMYAVSFWPVLLPSLKIK